MKRTTIEWHNMLKSVLRLACSPVVGAIEETNALHDIKFTTWWKLIGDVSRAYFAPLTGAIKGFRKELRRILHGQLD